MCRIIRGLDAFAQPINLTYRNETVYKTRSGGILTLFAVFVLLGYMITQVILLIKEPEFSSTTSTTYNMFTVNKDAIDVDKFTLTIASQLFSSQWNDTYVDLTARVQFYASSAEKNESGDWNYN